MSTRIPRQLPVSESLALRHGIKVEVLVEILNA